MNTLDQQRAQYAWERANRNTVVDGYREMVKGAPALIMGNGLMATLAYYHSRTGSNNRAASVLLEDVLGWLAKRQIVPADFRSAMNAFFNAGAQDVMRATDETLAMLRWLRQFADAVEGA
ncbi:MAG: type III-B CRISPR module-associated protein Cmr5 [Candidatus Accumulibacter sp.]|jgi:CRISPR-associated protein Cmr5|nr:type III-B CRISPR module-associated protein Cmr5 [Candidatus Accumulibacter necessarius]